MIRLTARAITKLMWMTSAATRNLALRSGRYVATLDSIASAWHRASSGPLAGYELFLQSPGSGDSILKGEYEAFILAFLLKMGVSLDGATVWDVGAHYGYLTLTFASLVGESGRILAFEPNPTNLRHVNNHVARNKAVSSRISIYSVALSEQDGHTVLRRDPQDQATDLGFLMDSGIPSDRIPAATYARFSDYEIETRTVDSIVAETGWAPDLLKVDVEGAEVLVLRGAHQTLVKHAPKLLIEVHSIQCMHDILYLLVEAGYRSTLVDDDRKSSSRAFIFAEQHRK